MGWGLTNSWNLESLLLSSIHGVPPLSRMSRGTHGSLRPPPSITNLLVTRHGGAMAAQTGLERLSLRPIRLRRIAKISQETINNTNNNNGHGDSDPQPRHGIRRDGGNTYDNDHAQVLMIEIDGYPQDESSYHSLRPAGVPPCTRAPRMASLAYASSALPRCLLLGLAASCGARWLPRQGGQRFT